MSVYSVSLSAARTLVSADSVIANWRAGEDNSDSPSPHGVYSLGEEVSE